MQLWFWSRGKQINAEEMNYAFCVPESKQKKMLNIKI